VKYYLENEFSAFKNICLYLSMIFSIFLVDPTSSCSEQPQSPVCDTGQQEHPNLCYLARAGRNFSYFGSCRADCRTDSPVCGSDGDTYLSECSALAFHRTVDYTGPCFAVALVTHEAKPICPFLVKCSPLPPGCVGVTPPGACCPICAGALRILYSKKQADRALYALQKVATDALSEQAIFNALEKQVSIYLHCVSFSSDMDMKVNKFDEDHNNTHPAHV